jgi:hypothetical protein
MSKREMFLAIQRIVDDPDRSDMEKIAAAFGEATGIFIAGSEREQALARALGDEETAVKEQIKSNVMRMSRDIFADVYTRVTGERSELWHE